MKGEQDEAFFSHLGVAGDVLEMCQPTSCMVHLTLYIITISFDLDPQLTFLLHAADTFSSLCPAQKPQVTPPSPDLKATSDYSMAGHRVTDWYDDTSTLPTPMRRIASTVNLVNVGASVVNVGVGMNGIKIGPGINPNISATNSLDMASTTINNPPIVNTGNNGP